MSQIEKVPEIIDVDFVPTTVTSSETPGKLAPINPQLKLQGQQCLDLIAELFPHEIQKRAPAIGKMVCDGDERGIARLQKALVKYKQDLTLNITNTNTTNTSIATTTNNNQVTHSHHHEGDRIVYVQPVYNVTYAPQIDNSSYYYNDSYSYEDNSYSYGGGGGGTPVSIYNQNNNQVEGGKGSGGGRGEPPSWNPFLWGFVGVMLFVLCASLARSLALDPIQTTPNHSGTVRIQP